MKIEVEDFLWFSLEMAAIAMTPIEQKALVERESFCTGNIAVDSTECNKAEPATKALLTDEAADDHLMRASMLRLISTVK